MTNLYLSYVDYWDYDAPGLCEGFAHGEFEVVEAAVIRQVEKSSLADSACYHIVHYLITSDGSVIRSYKTYRKADRRRKTDRESGLKVIVSEWLPELP